MGVGVDRWEHAVCNSASMAFHRDPGARQFTMSGKSPLELPLVTATSAPMFGLRPPLRGAWTERAIPALGKAELCDDPDAGIHSQCTRRSRPRSSHLNRTLGCHRPWAGDEAFVMTGVIGGPSLAVYTSTVLLQPSFKEFPLVPSCSLRWT
jgi:hypothetical protein